MGLSPTTRDIMKLTDQKGTVNARTVLFKVLRDQNLKESIADVRIESEAIRSPYGDHYIIVETSTPEAPVRGLHVMSSVRGQLYKFKSMSGYKKHVAQALVNSLRKIGDVVNCYAIIQEQHR